MAWASYGQKTHDLLFYFILSLQIMTASAPNLTLSLSAPSVFLVPEGNDQVDLSQINHREPQVPPLTRTYRALDRTNSQCSVARAGLGLKIKRSRQILEVHSGLQSPSLDRQKQPFVSQSRGGISTET